MKYNLKAAFLVFALLTIPFVELWASDSMSVAGFTSVYISMSGGEFTISGESVYSGTTFLKGESYQLSSGVLNSAETLPDTLGDAHVYPNPCNIRKGCTKVMFSKMTQSVEIRIYTVSGELVWQSYKNSSDPRYTWELINNKGNEVSSGLYIYYVKTGNSSKKGKIIVIR